MPDLLEWGGEVNAQAFTLPPYGRDATIARIAAVCRDISPGERVKVRLEVDGGPRTLEQNGGVWKLYELIALQYGDRTAREVMRECKLHHGVPLLRADDAEYRAAYDAVIKPLGYEQKMIAMDYWPVTRLFSRDQASRYLDEVQRQHGVFLESAA